MRKTVPIKFKGKTVGSAIVQVVDDDVFIDESHINPSLMDEDLQKLLGGPMTHLSIEEN